jgi:predicted amidohydrolase YtcJ
MAVARATIYENCLVRTLDVSLPRAEAMVTKGERVVWVGTRDQCQERAGRRPVTVDLDGATVVPGFTDAHIHCAQYARSFAEVQLRASSCLNEALTLIASHAAASSDEWIVGRGWDVNAWSDGRLPTKVELDRVSPDRPAAMNAADGHTTWVNSKALSVLGISRTTADPPGGEIVRDQAGEPVGLLRERATDRLRRVIAEQSSDLVETIHASMRTLLARGITSIHDIDQADALEAFEQLRASGRLDIRVHKLLPLLGLDQAIEQGRASGDGDAWIRLGAVKVFTDGALGSKTALMSQPFSGGKGNVGFEPMPLPELCELFNKASSAGFAVAAHAIGDRANSQCLAAFQYIGPPKGGLPHRIEHAQHVQPGDISKIAELGVCASMQPSHCTSDMDLAQDLLGDRDVRSYAWASLAKAGATVAFGSDAPIEAPDPFLGMHAAITRQRGDGTPSGGWQPEERLSIGQAMRAYTIAPAHLSGEQHLKGMLRPGMLADFAVLPLDPLDLEPADLRRLPVLATVVGGEQRWSR